MANAVYPKGKEALLRGEVDLEDDDIKIVLVTSSYTYDDDHETLDDVPGGSRVAMSAALTSTTVTGGAFDADDVTFVALTGSTVAAYVVFKDTGTESTSTLLAFIDTRGDTTPISYTPNGSDLLLTHNAAGIFTI